MPKSSDAQHAVFAVMDLVTRKWITELVSIEETSTQVQVVFLDALEAEGLLEGRIGDVITAKSQRFTPREICWVPRFR